MYIIRTGPIINYYSNVFTHSIMLFPIYLNPNRKNVKKISRKFFRYIVKIIIEFISYLNYCQQQVSFKVYLHIVSNSYHYLFFSKKNLLKR